MSTSTVVNEEAVFESNVKELAEKSIAFTCNKHNVSRDQLKREVISTAYAEARTKAKHEEELKADHSYQELVSARQKNRELELQIQALKMSKPITNESGNSGHAQSSRLPDSEFVRSQMGVAAWNSLTIDGRLTACGIAPSEVTASTKEEISGLFGRNPDSKRASDLHVQNPARYRQLKSIANILGLVGK